MLDIIYKLFLFNFDLEFWRGLGKISFLIGLFLIFLGLFGLLFRDFILISDLLEVVLVRDCIGFGIFGFDRFG